MPSYDSAYRPPPPPPPREREVSLSLSQSSCESPAELTNGTGVGEEPNHTKERKPSPLYSINHSNNQKKNTVVHRDSKSKHLFWAERIATGTVGYLVCLRGPSFWWGVGSQLPHAGVDVTGVEQALAHLFHLGHAHIAQVLRLLLRAPETANTNRICCIYYLLTVSGYTVSSSSSDYKKCQGKM